MSYKANIKNDYKFRDDAFRPPPWYRRLRYWALFSIFPLLLSSFGHTAKPGAEAGAAPSAPVIADTDRKLRPEPAMLPAAPVRTEQGIAETLEEVVIAVRRREPEPSGAATAVADDVSSNWVDIAIDKGDSLARIFSRRGLSAQNLYEIMQQGAEVSALQKLRPGQTISLLTETGEVQGLRFDINPYRRLLVNRENGGFTSEIVEVEPDARLRQAQGVISDSLFLSAQVAGLSNKLIMELVEIYSWDIDFMLEVRKGDSFKVIYEEHYKGAEKITDGPVLVAEFINRDRKIRAVRYQREDGRADYYDDNGHAMRKAFLRSPLKFSRISSHFNLKRRHPILNRIRAHKGVDYAAPSGTPIRAAGDGRVHYAGNKSGYGKTIILKHGAIYSTLYAHLSRYKTGIKQGQSIKQGQIIGYVGQTGLATGPHLHYEFHVNGKHRNPVTVDLPEADGISQSEMETFRNQTSLLFAMLDADEPAIVDEIPAAETRLASAENGLQNKL